MSHQQQRKRVGAGFWSFPLAGEPGAPMRRSSLPPPKPPSLSSSSPASDSSCPVRHPPAQCSVESRLLGYSLAREVTLRLVLNFGRFLPNLVSPTIALPRPRLFSKLPYTYSSFSEKDVVWLYADMEWTLIPESDPRPSDPSHHATPTSFNFPKNQIGIVF